MTGRTVGRTAMRGEIEAVPDVVGRFLAEAGPEVEAAAAAIRAADPAWVTLVARGTSDHAAIHLRYLIETELGIPAGMAAPSTVTIYGADLRWRGGLVIAVSQSGRSPDLVAVVAAARAGGAVTVAIVNDAESPLAAAADHVIDCRAGEERSVAATKSYVAQLAAGASLVAALARSGGVRDALPRLPRILADSLAVATGVVHDESAIVAEFGASERSIVIGRGFEYPTALETALKLKETCRLFAEGYSSADFSHGPVVLTGPEVPILAIRPDGRMGPLVDEGIVAALASGSVPWVVGGAAVAAAAPAGLDPARVISLPLPADLPEGLASLATILPGQLLAEAVARRRGYDPDAPPGLHKVTLTR
ncbi:MAG TPA: SIS domain-containing protein [Candidatus Limnocylindrales bacterium]|nr:SIS domain-containing protein [Candidatus Limnocylindrales bacterium]